MNQYRLILIIDDDTKTQILYSIVSSENHKIYENKIKLITNEKAVGMYINIIKIQEVETIDSDIYEKTYNIYSYIPKKSDLIINKYCDICSLITEHDVFIQNNNQICYYKCSGCKKTIFSDILISTLTEEKIKYTPPSNLLDLINSKFDFNSDERYLLRAGEICKELNMQDQNITPLHVSIVLRKNNIMPKNFLNKNYYPMPKLIGDDTFCDRYDKDVN